ncbi:methyl-accepting chemotaxis protein [Rhodopseudomonas palustris]|uniref:Methyl-accepting chemotaxis sensory transducer n=1 Tax=Rhodopseudomonas palustris (strain BisB18) TaxID=316056 RepID=Q211L6_RHOPB
MLRFIQNVRIGTKLWIASALGILLIGCMIYGQVTGSARVRQAQDNSVRVLALEGAAAEAKASMRGMQVGLAAIVLASNPEAMRAASDSFAAQQKSSIQFTAELAQSVRLPENKQRTARLTALIGEFAGATQQIAALRGEVHALEVGAMAAAEASTEAAKKIRALNDKVALIRKDKVTPIAAEMERLNEELIASSKRLSEHTTAAATEEAISVERWALAIGIANALLMIATSIFTSTTIARPMQALSRAMAELADGNFGVVLPGLGRKDEIGDVASAVETFKIKAEQKAQAEAEEKAQQDQSAAAQRKRDMMKLANEFEGAVGEIVETVSSASAELESSASTLTSTAEHAQHLATMVASASEEATTNVQSVASATEEMSSSITEISRQVQMSARIAGEAVQQAQKTNNRVGELAKAASRIGDVVELINTIAGQTNLLALNATIEAARAGEAGRGFAVVASEVKALAEQTAKATGEIGQQITGIQAATQESVGAIREIGDTISKMSEIASTIAAAVEQQGAATQEISRNVQQAAQGTHEVSSNITDVQRGASETGTASSQVLSAAQSLSRDSNRLKVEVGKFLQTVRSA